MRGVQNGVIGMHYCREKLRDILLDRVSIEERIDAQNTINRLYSRGDLPHWQKTAKYLCTDFVPFDAEIQSTLQLLSEELGYTDNAFAMRVHFKYKLTRQQLEIMAAQIEALEPGIKL